MKWIPYVLFFVTPLSWDGKLRLTDKGYVEESPPLSGQHVVQEGHLELPTNTDKVTHPLTTLVFRFKPRQRPRPRDERVTTALKTSPVVMAF